LAKEAKNPFLKSRLEELAKEEEGHYKILKQQYEEIVEFESVMYDEEFMRMDSRF
jgi:rubrerythrin